jgi:Tfp pilus assembly protein FimT
MDVLVGIVISAVLIGIAVPTIPALMDPYRLSFAARVVASEFSTARMKAIAQNRRHRITFDVDAGRYQLQEETAANNWTAVGGVHELPTGCSFGEIATTPTFDTRGMLDQAYDIEVSSANQTKTVSVNILGNVQINAS